MIVGEFGHGVVVCFLNGYRILDIGFDLEMESE